MKNNKENIHETIFILRRLLANLCDEYDLDKFAIVDDIVVSLLGDSYEIKKVEDE